MLTRNRGKDNVRIIQKCYIKAGETFFSQSTTLFSTIPANINISEFGLIPTNNILPQVLRKRTNRSHRLKPYPLKEITPLSTVNVLSVRKRKLELEEIEIKKRKLDYVTETTALKEEYESVLQKEQTILDARNRFTRYFKQSPWTNLDVAEKYKLSAFTVNNNGTHPRVGVLVESDKCKCVCYLRGYLKPLFVKIHANSDLLKKDGFIVTPCGGLDIVHIETEKPFAEFNTNGMTTFNGNSFAKIENFKFYTKTQQDYGEETQKVRYLLEFETIGSVFVSNYWLENELEESDKDLNYKLKIKLVVIKTTPT